MDYRAFRFDVTAADASLRKRRHLTSEFLLAGVAQHKTDVVEPTIEPRALEYLSLVQRHPGMPATSRDGLIGISLKRGSHLRRTLRDAGLLEEFHVSPGVRGKNYKDVRLTPEGLKMLENRSETGGQEKKTESFPL